MTELLSREKEFLKLNEQLNKLTTITMEQHQLQQQQQLQQHANNISTQQQQQQQQQQQSKGDQKFFTYTKTTSKGAKIEMRKRGAGDGVVENVGDTQGSLKERSNNNNNNSSNNNTNCSNNSTNNNNNNSVANSNTFRTGRFRQQHHSTAPTTTTTMTATANATPTADDCPTQMTSPSPPTEGRREATATITTTTLNSIAAAASHRIRQIAKTQDSQVSRTFSRSSTSRMPTAPTTATFTVKYRNPKFVESPSLEVLVKDESASIRPRPLASPSSRLASDADSTASVTTLGPGSVSRRSQMGGRKQISTDGLIKFLKSKIAILEEDHDRISQEMTQQKELLEKTLDRQKKVEQQRDQAYSKHNAISEQLTKVESQLEDATRRIKERLMDQSAQQKDLEQVKREVKVLTQTNTNLEKRLYRANEELENTKNALTMMKAAERELRETMRVESEGKDKQIKSLKKQRADLLNAYKKQLFLIDNLKRQNTCMEQSKMIGFAEKEFTKVLEWNTKT